MKEIYSLIIKETAKKANVLNIVILLIIIIIIIVFIFIFFFFTNVLSNCKLKRNGQIAIRFKRTSYNVRCYFVEEEATVDEIKILFAKFTTFSFLLKRENFCHERRNPSTN